MQKRKLWLNILVSTLLTLIIAACGSTGPAKTVTPAAPPKISSGENLYVVDGTLSANTGYTSQRIVTFHPGTSAQQVVLPTGLISLDHKGIYTATPQNGQTTITMTNAQTGATTRTFTIPGNYTTSGEAYTTSVLSADGHWLALREQGQPKTVSTIALVNTQTGKLAKTIQLNGHYDLDAISPDGDNIYVLEQLDDYDGHYHVRRYDVAQNQLVEGYIVDKLDPNENMNGTALTRQETKDGSVAYTLYTNLGLNKAFVHILPLDGYTPFARCLDLPVGKSASLLRYYTLTLSTDGRTLYAANGALGVITAMDVSSGVQVFSDKISASGKFDPGNVTTNNKSPLLYNGSALSPDQNTLYVVGTHGIWAVGTQDLKLKGSFATRQAFTGIALSGNGQTLYGVQPTDGLTMVNVTSGQAQQVAPGPLHNPWGIAWVTH